MFCRDGEVLNEKAPQRILVLFYQNTRRSANTNRSNAV
ncbi:hypothetical protein Amal_03302 [Acetobacter malorum]|uniref:Uncharacterized protein n=1 Tax=Acetobacter malorum TaxID=178901 RepID=A0A177G5A3_9PROT|nr:hypothetical protein Amal_03302 [Acetobacter malorum]